MRKEILTHLAYLIVFSFLVVIFRWWVQPTLDNGLRIGLFLLGGLIGTILPDVDHLIYVYILKPHELTSMRVNNLVQRRNFVETFELMSATRGERMGLIFHTAHFQIIFWILTFLVVSSSGSVLGRGLVLAFSLHLIVDQLLDLLQIDTLDNWFRRLNLSFEKEQYMFYWVGNVVILLVFGFVL